MHENPVPVLVALVFVLPYATGTMIHHFLTRHWEKAIGWLLIFSFCSTMGLAMLTIMAVRSGEVDPNIQILNLIRWVMLAQALLWALFRFMYQRRREPGGWRTVAASACLISLAVAFLVPVTYNAIRQQRIVQGQELMDEVGYMPYPGADYPDGKLKNTGGGPGYECLSVRFLTDDDPEQVFDFYEQCAESAGLQVHLDTSSRYGTHVLWAVGDTSAAMKVEHAQSSDEWRLFVYWSADYSVAVDSDGRVYVE